MYIYFICVYIDDRTLLPLVSPRHVCVHAFIFKYIWIYAVFCIQILHTNIYKVKSVRYSITNRSLLLYDILDSCVHASSRRQTNNVKVSRHIMRLKTTCIRQAINTRVKLNFQIRQINFISYIKSIWSLWKMIFFCSLYNTHI